MTTTFMLIFASALVMAIGGTPVVRRIALRLGIIDHPNARKIHVNPVPLLGGVAIYGAFGDGTVGVQGIYQLGAGERLAGLGRQRGKQLELGAGQVHGLPGNRSPMVGQIKLQSAEADNIRAFHFLSFGPAQQGLGASHDLSRMEGSQDKIVCVRFARDQSFGLLRAVDEHKNRHVASLAQPLADL